MLFIPRFDQESRNETMISQPYEAAPNPPQGKASRILLNRMNSRECPLILAVLAVLTIVTVPCRAQDLRGAETTESETHSDPPSLTSGEYFVTQTWSQERDFHRPYYVSVPQGNAGGKLPVFIYLHGNGGNAKRAMQGFARRSPEIVSRYILVFPQGYRESWNIVSERSKADDRGFIEAIIKKLAANGSVDRDNVTVMGNSNGAALVNQLAIECRLPNIRNYISGVSPLNVWQHDGNSFKAKGAQNDYATVVQPAGGKRLLNISGTDDRLVPYGGGTSRVIPAKGGKLAFVAAERSTFLWAKQMGYQGKQLNAPTRTSGRLQFFSYLDGDVVHIKVANEGHGAAQAVAEEILLDFLQTQQVEE